MKVQDIMTTPVVSVAMDDRLQVVYNIFCKVRFHHLLVLDNQQVVGVLTDRDLFKAISPNSGTELASSHDEAMLNKRVHQIMRRNPVTIKPTESLLTAVHLINAYGITCLPVVDGNEHCMGIVSWRDIMRHIEKAQTARQSKS